MRLRIAAVIVLAAVSVPVTTQARPFPPQPDWCVTQFHRGPIATSCPFVYGGGRVWTFGATVATEAPAGITIEVVAGQGLAEQVLFQCTSPADRVGPVTLPTSECVRRSSFLPVADGTILRCRHRGPGQGVFGCLST